MDTPRRKLARKKGKMTCQRRTELVPEHPQTQRCLEQLKMRTPFKTEYVFAEKKIERLYRECFVSCGAMHFDHSCEFPRIFISFHFVCVFHVFHLA